MADNQKILSPNCLNSEEIAHHSECREGQYCHHMFVHMSLPSNQIKNNISYYQQKLSVYNFLQRPPRGVMSFGYHIFVTCVLFTCLVLTVFSTIPDFANKALVYLKIMDSFVLIFFSAEFIARLWSSECILHYRGWKGKLSFLRSYLRIIDLIIIYSTAAVLFFDHKSVLVSTSLRGIRFLQVCQVLEVEHRLNPWRTMVSVVWAQREHLAITAYMGGLALIMISFTMYFIEKDINPAFESLATSLWWGVVTLTTIGYGDMTPMTPIGKLLSCIICIVGVAIFSLPAGILGTGLALKVQEQQRLRKLSKRRTPAAQLIQSIWRCYAADKKLLHKISYRKSSKYRVHRSVNPENNAIKFILAVKYFIARRNFSTALKPYDIKDVLEQYASGHADVLATVKQMESRMGAIEAVVNSNFKMLQESTTVTSSQMAKTEQIFKDSLIGLNDLKEAQHNNHFISRSNSRQTSFLSHQYQIESITDSSLKSKALKKSRKSF